MKLYDVHNGWVNLPEDTFPCDFICDIDGTVADLGHRLHYIKTKPKNWKAFEAGISRDRPIERIVNQVKEMQKMGGNLLMCSGRGEQTRKDTEDWLEDNGLHPTKLYMRPEGDYRKDSIIKAELLQEIYKDGWKPKFVLDDRDQVVEMWRSKKLVCIQVNYGNF